MNGDPDAFAAMWMKDEGIFTGSIIGGNLCFSPDETVSRGEFLVMVMKLVDAEASESQMTSGFADEAMTPGWMQPYIVSALGNGMISGISSEEGMLFRPSASLTGAEAAVMLQNILQLPASDTTPVFSQNADDTIPVWAAEAAAALSQAGIDVELTHGDDPISRRDVAKIFYHVSVLLQGEEASAFHWAA